MSKCTVELPESIFTLGLATAAFGVQQFVNLLHADGVTKAEAASYKVTSAVQERFSSNPVLFGLDQIGDEAQRSAVDLFADLLKLKPMDPRWLGSASEWLVRRSFDTALALLPVENLENTWKELRNTLAVINLVNQAPSTLNLPPGEIRLLEALDRAYSAGGEYAALWLVEGLGEEYAVRNSLASRPARGLLTSSQGADLPEKSLLMMHAGIGIGFAKQIIRPLTPYSQDGEVASALKRFIELVRNNARNGYEGPAFESLGLVTQTWYSQMVPLIDRVLWTIDAVALEYFWHGVGRAEYFNALLPGQSPFRIIAEAAPHRLALLNGIAGAAWAFTLVNIKQPEITVHLLKQQSGLLQSNDAFTNGVLSTLLMAEDMLPNDPYATKFADFQPSLSDIEAQGNWDRIVRVPARDALDRLFPILQRNKRLGEVFRYQNLEKLASSLEAHG
jgi:hypothetical protein